MRNCRGYAVRTRHGKIQNLPSAGQLLRKALKPLLEEVQAWKKWMNKNLKQMLSPVYWWNASERDAEKVESLLAMDASARKASRRVETIEGSFGIEAETDAAYWLLDPLLCRIRREEEGGGAKYPFRSAKICSGVSIVAAAVKYSDFLEWLSSKSNAICTILLGEIASSERSL